MSTATTGFGMFDKSSYRDTSLAAYDSVTNISEKQYAVLRVLKFIVKGSDESIAGMYTNRELFPDLPQQSSSGLRTRRSELVTQGLVRDSGLRSRTPSNRIAVMWEITTAGKKFKWENKKV